MTLLVSVDPGARVGGLAIFYERKLIHCELIEVDRKRPEPEWAREFAQRVLRSAQIVMQPVIPSVTVVTENQVIDSRTKNANSLLGLARTVGAIEASFQHASLVRWMPNEWKGSVSAGVVWNRIVQHLNTNETMESLRCFDAIARTHPKTGEKGLGELQGHVLDAIGIGLFHLGRAGRAMTGAK